MPYFRPVPADDTPIAPTPGSTPIVEALQFTGDNSTELVNWANAWGKLIKSADASPDGTSPADSSPADASAPTLLIEHYAAGPDEVVNAGDWVLRHEGPWFEGVTGEELAAGYRAV